MTKEERIKFRNTKAWKAFRDDMRYTVNDKGKRVIDVDGITGSKLGPRYNLHHLSANDDEYTDLNPYKFAKLNQQSHQFIHWLYTQYLKDPGVLNRVENIIKLMSIYSNGRDFK